MDADGNGTGIGVEARTSEILVAQTLAACRYRLKIRGQARLLGTGSWSEAQPLVEDRVALLRILHQLLERHDVELNAEA